MTDPRERAPSAGEGLEREAREAETAVPDGSGDDHDSEAGDTLTPNLGAQQRATHAAGIDGSSNDAGEDGPGEDGPGRGG